MYAQLSALIPILGYQLYRLAVWVYSEKQRTKFDYSAIPSSPTSKRERQSSSGAAVRKWRATLWWLEGEVAEGWGERGHWIAAGCWMAWLLFLCVHKTGDGQYHFLDYAFDRRQVSELQTGPLRSLIRGVIVLPHACFKFYQYLFVALRISAVFSVTARIPIFHVEGLLSCDWFPSMPCLWTFSRLGGHD